MGDEVGYRQLDVWQKAMDLAEQVYEVTVGQAPALQRTRSNVNNPIWQNSAIAVGRLCRPEQRIDEQTTLAAGTAGLG